MEHATFFDMDDGLLQPQSPPQQQQSQQVLADHAVSPFTVSYSPPKFHPHHHYAAAAPASPTSPRALAPTAAAPA
ncbi:hypothetical protein FRC17_006721, partial [Serendipita sp. 399]